MAPSLQKRQLSALDLPSLGEENFTDLHRCGKLQVDLPLAGEHKFGRKDPSLEERRS